VTRRASTKEPAARTRTPVPPSPPGDTLVSARDVDISYSSRGKTTRAVSGLDLSIHKGELVAVVGPSGCGKSTFLMALDGLVPVSGGDLLVGQKQVSGPARDRAVVFQDASLLPWRTALGNVIYGLQLARTGTRASRHERAMDLLKMVGLANYSGFYPRQLSGGMQQRVNIARALALDPPLLLLDEPFGALDAQTRETMQSEFLRIWDSSDKTAVFVTHQIDEAIYLADRVLVFSARPGRIVLEEKIPFPRPRSLELKQDPAFGDIERKIWTVVREQLNM
jgi:NitT/TauT family transport system ATP-binding protein